MRARRRPEGADTRRACGARTLRRLPGCFALALLAPLATAPGARALTTTPLVGVHLSPDSVRQAMAIPSRDGVRGRIDSTGYALHASQMAKVWELSGAPPAPDSLGPVPAPGVAAILCPHDDFAFAGRVYRRVIPLVTARTVVLFGVFHGYWRVGERDRVVFDPYREWTAPDGPVRVSPLRDALLARLPREDWTRDSVAHDMEHSLEPLVCWLRHVRPDLEIVPILVPAARFGRLEALADHLGAALEAEMKARGLRLGRDLAIAISADGIHYGPDFGQLAFGEGGIAAYQQATAKDRALLQGPLAGPLDVAKIRALYETFVDPDHPDTYRWTWCGRFSVPLGLLTLRRVAPGAIGWPLAYATSISGPELGLRGLGMQPGSPSNLYHFVGYPGAAFTAGEPAR
ncbi:MAG TPA: AmmeMemoRadiSam system protein B [Candidatus Eisenbacteria bacterium]|jgi:AmmeMemoRadiSam system protein B